MRNGSCDALSRLPVEDDTPVFDSEYTSINYVIIIICKCNNNFFGLESIRLLYSCVVTLIYFNNL